MIASCNLDSIQASMKVYGPNCQPSVHKEHLAEYIDKSNHGDRLTQTQNKIVNGSICLWVTQRVGLFSLSLNGLHCIVH